MRRERSALRAIIRQSGRGPAHVAALTRSEVGRIKSQGVALRELGVLPLIINGEGADELVLVQRIWQVSLVAGGAEFRLPIKRLHYGFGVTFGMFEDFAK